MGRVVLVIILAHTCTHILIRHMPPPQTNSSQLDGQKTSGLEMQDIIQIVKGPPGSA